MMQTKLKNKHKHQDVHYLIHSTHSYSLAFYNTAVQYSHIILYAADSKASTKKLTITNNNTHNHKHTRHNIYFSSISFVQIVRCNRTKSPPLPGGKEEEEEEREREGEGGEVSERASSRALYKLNLY